MAAANPDPGQPGIRHPFMFVPYDIHMYIVKLLPLKDALAYSEVTHVTRASVMYVFAHRK